MSLRSLERELNAKMLAAFPEVASEYREWAVDPDGQEPAAHNAYSMVLVSWILSAVDAGHLEVLSRVAAFVETLNTADDFVGEVVQLSLLEPLHDHPEAWLPLVPELGPKGAAIARIVDEHFGPSVGD